MIYVNTEINAAYATSLTSLGRADTSGENATARFTKECIKLDILPTYLLSPNDRQGTPDACTLSTASPAQYADQLEAYAAGMGNCPKGLIVKTNLELIQLSALQLKTTHEEAKTLHSATKDAAGKRQMERECRVYDATRKARNTLLSKISSKLRDKSLVLVTAYCELAKHVALQAGKTTKEANAIKAARKAELLASMGKGEKATTPATEKDANKVFIQQAKNLASAAEKATPKMLTSREFNALSALLVKITEVAH